jgi:hypothetical protein
MKKLALVLLTIISSSILIAQEPADALRFSWTTPGGTARQQAIGGAMTSLGGDLTATFVNPAGLAFYRTGDFVISPAYRFGKNKASYIGRNETEKEGRFNLGTTGFVFGSAGNERKKVRNTAFSLGFNTMADFKSDILYRGDNNKTSYSQKFVEELNKARFQRPQDAEESHTFGSSLAYNIFLIDTINGGTPGNYRFQSNAANLVSGGLLQEHSIKNRGGIYEFAVGFAANYNDKLMLGGSLGLPFIDYRREAIFNEADATTNAANDFDYFSFQEKLSTNGAGLNAKLGLIYKPQEYWRLGLAIHSPTFYSLTDKYETSIEANLERPDGKIFADYSKDYTNNQPSEFKYTLTTPYRVMGSISYVLREIQDVTKQRGFLTADLEYVNYKASSFGTDSENGENDESTKSYLKSLNKAIDNAYKGAFNFRAGGELKFTTIMVRLGGAYLSNPYKNMQGQKGNKVNLTGGLGYRDKGFFIDLTYIHSMNKDVHMPYRLESAVSPVANIRSTSGNIFLTAGVKF